ncbi:MAG TPA: calcium/proton exchanger [Candidatus Dormibacteraeota bacterium]|nr:calcium/proton exchanger [Candidatus Dormibacteraeota bacterium]
MPRPSLSWLLVFVPISVAAELLHGQPVLIFVTTSLAIVPLAGLIGSATEQLAIYAGPRIGGLLNATFGNVTEVIIGVLLVRAAEFDVVKASLIGSILGNLVLVLGASYLAGGIRFRYREQRYSRRAAGMHAASLLLAVAALVVPAVFVLTTNETSRQRETVSVLVAVVLIALYGASLLFSLMSPAHLFGSRQVEDRPDWSLPRALAVLLVSALVVGVESEFLVGSITPAASALGISKVFVGLFIVAVVGNAAEHASAVLFAVRDKMDLAIEISLNSSTQIALLVAPLLVLVSLPLQRQMDFVFMPTEVVAVTLATVIVAVITSDGRSNWLEGLQLLAVYVILGVAFLIFPVPAAP